MIPVVQSFEFLAVWIMAISERGSQYLVLQLGAVFAVTASVSLAELADDAARPGARVMALRAAAQSGCLTLLSRGETGCVPLAPGKLAQTFDRAPVEKPTDGTGKLSSDSTQTG